MEIKAKFPKNIYDNLQRFLSDFTWYLRRLLGDKRFYAHPDLLLCTQTFELIKYEFERTK